MSADLIGLWRGRPPGRDSELALTAAELYHLTGDPSLREAAEQPLRGQPGDVARGCRTCRQVFLLSARDVRWFRRRHLALPSHCPRCREARRGRHA